MKKFDIKTASLGFIIGTLSVTTVFAASAVKSASVSGAKVTLDGKKVPLKNPLVAVTLDVEDDSRLYMPVRELLEYAGFEVIWDADNNTVHLNSENVRQRDSGQVIMYLTNKNTYNISESGSFEVKDNQVLDLDIQSDIKGGKVDLLLFDPLGKEKCITIGSEDMIESVKLTTGGTWTYSCSGVFTEGGNISIVGKVK